MALYQYECDCGNVFEEMLPMSESSGLRHCPKCGQLAPKVMAPTNFVLKGGGWSKENYGQQARKEGKLK